MKEGEAVTFKSIDSAIEEFGNMALPPQHYHTQTPSGMPPHELTLKEGCIVILLRNLDVSLGLCNEWHETSSGQNQEGRKCMHFLTLAQRIVSLRCFSALD